MWTAALVDTISWRNSFIPWRRLPSTWSKLFLTNHLTSTYECHCFRNRNIKFKIIGSSELRFVEFIWRTLFHREIQGLKTSIWKILYGWVPYLAKQQMAVNKIALAPEREGVEDFDCTVTAMKVCIKAASSTCNTLASLVCAQSDELKAGTRLHGIIITATQVLAIPLSTWQMIWYVITDPKLIASYKQKWTESTFLSQTVWQLVDWKTVTHMLGEFPAVVAM